MIFSDTPAHDDGITGHGGATMLQLYGGMTSGFLAGYPTVHTGEVTDISAWLTFHFWQEVFFEEPDKSERLGRWASRSGSTCRPKGIDASSGRVSTIGRNANHKPRKNGSVDQTTCRFDRQRRRAQG